MGTEGASLPHRVWVAEAHVGCKLSQRSLCLLHSVCLAAALFWPQRLFTCDTQVLAHFSLDPIPGPSTGFRKKPTQTSIPRLQGGLLWSPQFIRESRQPYTAPLRWVLLFDPLSNSTLYFLSPTILGDSSSLLSYHGEQSSPLQAPPQIWAPNPSWCSAEQNSK